LDSTVFDLNLAIGETIAAQVVVVVVWGRLDLNPHPPKAEGAAPRFNFDSTID